MPAVRIARDLRGWALNYAERDCRTQQQNSHGIAALNGVEGAYAAHPVADLGALTALLALVGETGAMPVSAADEGQAVGTVNLSAMGTTRPAGQTGRTDGYAYR